ncbi:MAG: protein kinase, partial [Anaerolineae bacterium]|nr:protein kinase [Anaerolineae bacterium]
MPDVKVIHCHPSPHIGETLTVNFLRHHLPGGVLLVNYHLPDVAGTQEIDVVALNYNGVYLLEVKHWLGAIEADQVHWRHASGDLRLSPVPIVEQKARQMHGFLASRGWENVSVVGLVILSKGVGALTISDPQAHKVFGLHESLIEALTGRDYVFRPNCRTLRSSELHRLRDAILDAHVTDTERRVAGYRVLEERERGLYVELTAADPEFTGRKARIKQYDVPTVGSARELEEAVSRFKRDMAALVEAGPHPNLVMPYQFRRDESSDERYYLILEWVGDHTLADRLAAGPVEPGEQLRILGDVAAALAHCHAHGVYHRNLSPTSVYLTFDGRAKVGDFDFARVPTVSRTLAQTGKRLVEGRHVAPEQAFHASDVDARADVYSLGAVWYDMLFRPGPDEPLERERIAQSSLSEDGRQILLSMLTERRGDRPTSM